MENLILHRSVNTHIFCGSVVRDFVVKGCQFRHLDEVAETLLLHQIISNVKLEVGSLLGEDCRPSIEAPYLLPFKFFWS
jgi:hypothetical protein